MTGRCRVHGNTGWPALIGFSLMRLGELLRHLGQLDQSRIVLQEALESLDANQEWHP